MTSILGMDEAVVATEDCIIGSTYENNVFSLPDPKLSVPEIEILKAKVKALSDYNDFLEDCLVEMALTVYD